MAFKKWLRNHLGREEKETFNHNVDETEKQIGSVNMAIESMKQRINNLVLKSGGDSPTEIVDSRVDFEGNTFGTLSERLNSNQQVLLAGLETVNSSLQITNEQNNELQERVNTLYGDTEENISVYISASIGNDESADGTMEKPFKTIQAAVNSVPIITSANVYFEIEPGVYKEDVVIQQIQAPSLTVRGTNNNTVDAKTADTGVYIRSMRFNTLPGYVSLRGLTQIDAANSGAVYQTTKLWLHFTRVGYGSIGNCRAVENTKGMSYAAVYTDGSKVTLGESNLSNQDIVFWSNFLSTNNFDTTNVGTNNNLVVRCGRSVVFSAGRMVTGTTALDKYGAGQVFE